MKTEIRKRYWNCDILNYECSYIKGTDIRHGPHTWYYNNGNISLELNYKNGFLSGIYKNWFTNKKILELISYKNNQRHGLKFWFNYES